MSTRGVDDPFRAIVLSSFLGWIPLAILCWIWPTIQTPMRASAFAFVC